MSSEESDFENDPETETRHQRSFTIISTNVLQKMLKTFAVCKNCGEQLEIGEKTSASVSLGEIWQFSCTSTACDTNKSDGTAMTPKNGDILR